MRTLLPFALFTLSACITSTPENYGPVPTDASYDRTQPAQDAAIAVDASVDAGVDATIDAAQDASLPEDAAPVDAAPDVADGAVVDAAPLDAAPDACTTRHILVGGSDVVAQGWTVTAEEPKTITNGADYVELQTSTPDGGATSGQLLLAYPAAVEAGKPFKLEIVMQVLSTDPHNAYDSAAAIMGSNSGGLGTAAERGEMVYLDGTNVGWADDSASFPFNVIDGAYHTYLFSVDAANVARLSIDGAPALTRNDFATTGTIAIGDQTNDPNVDSTLRIRSVSLLCP